MTICHQAVATATQQLIDVGGGGRCDGWCCDPETEKWGTHPSYTQPEEGHDTPQAPLPSSQPLSVGQALYHPLDLGTFRYSINRSSRGLIRVSQVWISVSRWLAPHPTPLSPQFPNCPYLWSLHGQQAHGDLQSKLPSESPVLHEKCQHVDTVAFCALHLLIDTNWHNQSTGLISKATIGGDKGYGDPSKLTLSSPTAAHGLV